MSTKRKPDPADHETWADWQEARSRAGMLADSAKSVPIAAVMVIIIGVVAWVVASRSGGTLDEEVLREGRAEITGTCSNLLEYRSCPAEVTWDDGTTERTDVRATRDLSGTVDVEEHETFDTKKNSDDTKADHLDNIPVAWSADHRPQGNPLRFPLIFGGSMLVALVLAAFVISRGGRWFEHRSRRIWAAARRHE